MDLTCSLVIMLLALVLQLCVSSSFASSRGFGRHHGKAKTNDSKTVLEDLMERMDERIKPPSQEGKPVVIKCGFYIVSFGSISEISMDYKTSILFREVWSDPRLEYDPSKGPSVSLSNVAQKQMWIPDIYFPNEKQAKFHDITVPNTLMKIYPNGTVIHSMRITLQLSCPMNLAAFPMDTQICMIKLESFAYETHDLDLEWLESAVELDKDMELPQFDFGIIRTSTCSKIYKTTGSFSCLKASFTLHRQFGFFLLQTYIPSVLIVILSWVSFWINMDAVPARISLGVTTVLTMTTQLSGSTNSIPKVSYPKAIDVWLSVCMMFVFASLIEYAFVNALSRKYKKDKYKKTDDEKDQQMGLMEQPTSDVNVSTGMVFVPKWGRCNQRDIARNIDKVSRILFPSSFFLFNVIYWPVYTNIGTS